MSPDESYIASVCDELQDHVKWIEDNVKDLLIKEVIKANTLLKARGLRVEQLIMVDFSAYYIKMLFKLRKTIMETCYLMAQSRDYKHLLVLIQALEEVMLGFLAESYMVKKRYETKLRMYRGQDKELDEKLEHIISWANQVIKHLNKRIIDIEAIFRQAKTRAESRSGV